MTPQEQQLVAELFDRLTKLENAPRDPDAERLIGDGGKRAPHALYVLVQTALVQDEALKRANVRIQELQQQLQAELEGGQPQQPQGSFLDTMREAVFGPGGARGSVPSVQPQAPNAPSAYQTQAVSPRAVPAYPAQPAYPAAPGYPAGPGSGFAPAGGAFGGGSFLGTAASVAAGAVGGGLLLDGIRSMFSHHSGLGGNDAFAVPGDRVAAWNPDTRSDDLARQAGIDDIGPRDFVANQADDQGLTQTSDNDQFVDDDNFDTADSGGGDDSYDV